MQYFKEIDMSLLSPHDLGHYKAAASLKNNIEIARTHTESVLEQKYGDSNSPIEIEYHSMPFEAVELMVHELKSRGWTVLSARINRGHYSHYVTVKNKLKI
jgi:hypothetical protein